WRQPTSLPIFGVMPASGCTASGSRLVIRFPVTGLANNHPSAPRSTAPCAVSEPRPAPDEAERYPENTRPSRLRCGREQCFIEPALALEIEVAPPSGRRAC